MLEKQKKKRILVALIVVMIRTNARGIDLFLASSYSAGPIYFYSVFLCPNVFSLIPFLRWICIHTSNLGKMGPLSLSLSRSTIALFTLLRNLPNMRISFFLLHFENIHHCPCSIRFFWCQWRCSCVWVRLFAQSHPKHSFSLFCTFSKCVQCLCFNAWTVLVFFWYSLSWFGLVLFDYVSTAMNAVNAIKSFENHMRYTKSDNLLNSMHQ